MLIIQSDLDRNDNFIIKQLKLDFTRCKESIDQKYVYFSQFAFYLICK